MVPPRNALKVFKESMHLIRLAHRCPLLRALFGSLDQERGLVPRISESLFKAFSNAGDPRGFRHVWGPIRGPEMVISNTYFVGTVKIPYLTHTGVLGPYKVFG